MQKRNDSPGLRAKYSLGGLGRAEFFEEPGGQARFVDLRRTAHGHIACRHVLGDDRSGRRHCAVTDRDGGDKHRVRSDEDIVADLGPVLEDAVVVAGDRASPDVRAVADAGIADIGQMIDLAAFANHGFLGFDKISNFRVRAEFGAWT